MAAGNGSTINRLLEQTSAQRTAIMTGFVETQRIQLYGAYTGFRAYAQKGSIAEIREGWQIRLMDAGPDSLQDWDPFGTLTFARKDVMGELSIEPRMWWSHLNCKFDQVSELFNKPGSKGHRFKMRDADESAAYEALINDLDKTFLAAPYSVSSRGRAGILGAAYWLAMSMTSNGTFVEQPVPRRVGIYTKTRNGSVTSLVAGGDRAHVNGDRLRTVAGTHNGIMNKALVEQISDAAAEAEFTFIEGLKGDVPAGAARLRVYMDTDLARDYRKIRNDMSGERRSDFFNAPRMGEVDQMQIIGVRAENMPNPALREIFGINHTQMVFKRVDGAWGRDFQHKEGPTVYVVPRLWGGQMKCESPALAGFRLHGRWS